MKKYINGKIVEMSDEELDAMQEQAARAEAEEKNRPMTENEVTRLFIEEQINKLVVDDVTAYRMRDFYPEWEDVIGKTVDEGYKFNYNGLLYKTIPTTHTFAAEWIPGSGTESLYTRIDETHDGTKYDPISYDGNMALESGKYYVQDGVTYLCTRDTGNPVYNALNELCGIYVEAAE
ncbi:MAG: hypothetical protein ACI3XP_03840 [Eubacteriales bacterium]